MLDTLFFQKDNQSESDPADPVLKCQGRYDDRRLQIERVGQGSVDGLITERNYVGVVTQRQVKARKGNGTKWRCQGEEENPRMQ